MSGPRAAGSLRRPQALSRFERSPATFALVEGSLGDEQRSGSRRSPAGVSQPGRRAEAARGQSVLRTEMSQGMGLRALPRLTSEAR